jgi:hypothetical protein
MNFFKDWNAVRKRFEFGAGAVLGANLITFPGEPNRTLRSWKSESWKRP